MRGDPFAAASLGVDLSLNHLGLIAWGERGEDAARGLAATLGRPLLVVPTDEETWWGWISGYRPIGEAGERALARFRPPDAAGMAVGLPGVGEAGFRATHRQALRARWVTRGSGRGLVLYGDVALEALATVQDEDARAFIAHELRGLDDDSPRSARLRETIAAYFAAEHNATSAAAALGAHPQTIANRLRVAEDLLGRPVGSRRAELEVALRLRGLFGRSR